MANADEAMYAGKRIGKKRPTFFSETMYGKSFGKHEETPR